MASPMAKRGGAVSDLAILRAFAAKLRHPAEGLLERVLAVYVDNQPARVYDHFYGLLEAKADLVGYALFDRLPRGLPEEPPGTRRSVTAPVRPRARD